MFSVSRPDDDDIDFPIDFENAQLYLAGIQTILSTVGCSIVALVCCSAMPAAAVSTLRTLVIAALLSSVFMRKPIRLGKVRGLSLVFDSLRPCLLIYVISLVCEQLTHTCTRDVASPSWRRLVFHGLIFVCMLSGIARARRPLEDTDAPFLVTATALFSIAMLPPPAVMLAGPLCSAPTLVNAAERIVRSFTFAATYTCFVYAAAPPRAHSGETLVCVMRAAAASVWTLGCHVALLPLAVVQCSVVVYNRVFQHDVRNDEKAPLLEQELPTRSPSPEVFQNSEPFAVEAGIVEKPPESGLINPSFPSIGPRSLADISKTTSGTLSKERMEEIAANIPHHD